MGWHTHAACRGSNPDVFYGPDQPRDDSWADQARAVCSTCPVSAACLLEALDSGEKYGIWGGLTPDERRQLLKHRGAA